MKCNKLNLIELKLLPTVYPYVCTDFDAVFFIASDSEGCLYVHNMHFIPEKHFTISSHPCETRGVASKLYND
jgi:hypothetical protein